MISGNFVLDYYWNDPKIVYESYTKKWHLVYICELHSQPEHRAAAQHSLRVVYNETRVEQPKVGGENFPYLKRLGYSKPRERCSRQQFCIESPTPNFNQLTFGFFSPKFISKLLLYIPPFFLLFPPFSFLPFLWFQLCPPNFCWLEILALFLQVRYSLCLLSLQSAFIFTFPTPLSHPHPVQLKFKRTPGIREWYLAVCGLCCG